MNLFILNVKKNVSLLTDSEYINKVIIKHKYLFAFFIDLYLHLYLNT